MDKMHDNVWQRRGVSWIWDDSALATVANAPEVASVRELIRMPSGWPGELPSNNGDTLVVAGLDACLDLLIPSEAEMWLEQYLKRTILDFQEEYEGNGALIFWLPQGNRRLHTEVSSDAVHWQCAGPHSGERIDFGRPLWGEAQEYPKEIIMNKGAGHVGLTHARIT